LISLVYLDAALRKLYFAGFDWTNGYTLQYSLLKLQSIKPSAIGAWLGQQHELAKLLSWITLTWEATFFVVLIWRRSRWIYVPLGVALHVGMCAARVACFYQFLALYVAFVTWPPLVQHLAKSRVRSE
jgi:hypothetical protein